MMTVPHIMVVLERMLDYRGVGLARFHCIHTKFAVKLHTGCVVRQDMQSITHSTGSGVTVTGTIHTITGVVIVLEVATRIREKNTARDAAM